METTIDRAGRLVVPQALREAIGLRDGGAVDVVELDGAIVIRPKSVAKRLVEQDGIFVCVTDEPMPVLDAETVRELLESMRR